MFLFLLRGRDSAAAGAEPAQPSPAARSVFATRMRTSMLCVSGRRVAAILPKAPSSRAPSAIGASAADCTGNASPRGQIGSNFRAAAKPWPEPRLLGRRRGNYPARTPKFERLRNLRNFFQASFVSALGRLSLSVLFQHPDQRLHKRRNIFRIPAADELPAHHRFLVHPGRARVLQIGLQRRP